jgi:hypothetical protein
MTWRNCEPGGAGSPAAALGHSSQPQSYRTRWDGQPFCELHHSNLVDQLPRPCPLRAANPVAAIGRLRDAAFRELRGTGSPDADSAVDLFAQLDVCDPCVGRSLANRTIQRLRRELGVTL